MTPNKLTGVNPQIAKPNPLQNEFGNYDQADKYDWQPSRQATNAIQTVYDQISKIQADLVKNNPQIANSNWDTVLQDGKLKVTGNLSDNDRAWLEKRSMPIPVWSVPPNNIMRLW